MLPRKKARRRRRQGHGIGGALAAVASSPVLTGCSFWNNTAVAELSTSSGGGESWNPLRLRMCAEGARGHAYADGFSQRCAFSLLPCGQFVFRGLNASFLVEITASSRREENLGAPSRRVGVGLRGKSLLCCGVRVFTGRDRHTGVCGARSLAVSR